MKRTVKGFTLIELIVVMAIFGIILASAMSFLTPVTKIMNLTDAQETGNAAVSNISQFLENELSSVEYIDIYNTIGDPGDRAEDFALKYYEGVLRNGSTPASPSYAGGQIHVLTIDNASGGIIARYDYDVSSFETSNISMSLNTTTSNDSVINGAFYKNTRFNIQLGTFSDTTAFTVDPSNSNLYTYDELATHTNANNTQFSIECVVDRGAEANPPEYRFYTTTSLSMVNIMARNGVGVNTYFSILQDPADPTDVSKKFIGSITQNDPTTGTQERSYGAVDKSTRLFYEAPAPGTTVNYTFVYSYAPEILTN